MSLFWGLALVGDCAGDIDLDVVDARVAIERERERVVIEPDSKSAMKRFVSRERRIGLRFLKIPSKH